MVLDRFGPSNSTLPANPEGPTNSNVNIVERVATLPELSSRMSNITSSTASSALGGNSITVDTLIALVSMEITEPNHYH